ncbi:MAG: YcxB family protein [Clostridia bacterium]|nr:YcxB family protein [Clostridia bacterium]
MFTFITKLDNSKIGKLKIFQLKRIFVPMIFISLAIIACGIINIIQQSVIIGVIWIIVGLLYIPSVFIFTSISNKNDKTYKHLKYPSLDEEYIFDNSGVNILQTDHKNFNSKSSFKYNEIYKIYKSGNSYYLYINKDRVHIIDFSTITSGNLEDFENLLKNKLGKKYTKLLF